MVSTAPENPIHQVHAIWENRVMVTADSVNQGRPLNGLAGRVYLFGPEVGFPLKAEGAITVDLHEVLADGKTKMLERWEIDPVTLQKLCRTDTLGWGYTLFLPWATFRPDIQRVQLQVKFAPDRGMPLFSPASPVTLRQDGATPQVQASILPTSAKKN
jgi:hypothetical protein